MSSKTLTLALLVIATSLATVALAWLLVAPWRFERVLSEFSSGTIEPMTAVFFGGPLLAGAAAALIRLFDRQRASSGAPAVSDSAA